MLEGKYSIHELRQTTDKLKNVLKGVLPSAILGENSNKIKWMGRLWTILSFIMTVIREEN